MTEPLRLLGLDHIVLRVADLDTSIRFYETALFCVIERRLEDPILVQMRAGQSLIDLVPARTGAPPSALAFDHIALRVENFDEASLRQHFERLGIATQPVKERYGAEGFGPSLYIRDPDGLTIELKGAANRTLGSPSINRSMT